MASSLSSWLKLITPYTTTTSTKHHHSIHHKPTPSIEKPQPATSFSIENKETQTLTLICDFFQTLLTPTSPFPFFMLVAFEAGGPLRALLLLLLFPLLCALGATSRVTLKLMVFITFVGMRTKDMHLVARAVLPKFYLEGLNLDACEAVRCAKRKVVFSCFPKVMVEWFLKEYLGVEEVVGDDLHVVFGGRFYSGWCFPSPPPPPPPPPPSSSSSSSMGLKGNALEVLFGEEKADLGIVSSSCHALDLHLFTSYCKEICYVNKGEKKKKKKKNMPRDKYPKPLIFHDGRLAVLPDPLTILAIFLWLPFAIPLASFRLFSGVLLPYKITLILSAFAGIRIRVLNLPSTTTTTTPGAAPAAANKKGAKGVLYACNHKTLLDLVFLSVVLGRSVPSVTYSLSRLSEFLAPMRTIRLTRDRARDSAVMEELLREGDLAVCPEGTTCREPYLLRFSSLFAELTEEISPVAVDARVQWFYGTTASGQKWMDPIFFMMNPTPECSLEFLEKSPEDMTCTAGGRAATEVANWVQRQLGSALGFECTTLTRRDKYMMLAGNEGVVMQGSHERKYYNF